MKPVIQTSRLSFRAFTVDELDAVHVYAGDPEVTRYTGFRAERGGADQRIPAVRVG